MEEVPDTGTGGGDQLDWPGLSRLQWVGVAQQGHWESTVWALTTFNVFTKVTPFAKGMSAQTARGQRADHRGCGQNDKMLDHYQQSCADDAAGFV